MRMVWRCVWYSNTMRMVVQSRRNTRGLRGRSKWCDIENGAVQTKIVDEGEQREDGQFACMR